jgi:hypothetical protein
MRKEPFTRTDAHAVHRAMIEAEHQARERAEKMPSSANVLRTHAAELRVVREKILDELPPEARLPYQR